MVKDKKLTKTVLSVDFDYFFPIAPYDIDGGRWILFDWGHNEGMSDSVLDSIWHIRGSSFIKAEGKLPGSEGVEGFWSHFRFAPGVKLYLADSHKEMVAEEVFDDCKEVWNFDLHHDACYGKKQMQRLIHEMAVDCGSWLGAYRLHGASTHVRYPPWASFQMKHEHPDCPIDSRQLFDPEEELPVYDRIFLCRSSHWVPPWIDGDFKKLVDECPAVDKMYLQPVRDRRFDMNCVMDFVNQQDALIKQLGVVDT